MAKTVKGLNRAIAAMGKIPQESFEILDQVFEANAMEITTNAKSIAPLDLGKLRQSIGYYKKEANGKTLAWAVGANTTGNAPYAPYVEFGTGTLVEVPKEMQDIAIKFKGKGIRKVNLRPRPYLYPSFVRQIPQILEDVKMELGALIKSKD